MKKSLALLEKEKKQKQVTFYKDYHSEILKGCTQPDEENDMDKGHGKHYYSCVNPRSFLKLTAITATALVTLQ